MATTINAVASTGLVQTSDGSGILNVQSNGVNTNAAAWINFNGNSGITINSQYNVSSVTRNAAGDYTINFANALIDANYSIVAMGTNTNASAGLFVLKNASSTTGTPSLKSTTQCEIVTGAAGGGLFDTSNASVIAFR